MKEITVFIPAIKGKQKTAARGFWRDNNKTYYDYIIPRDKIGAGKDIPAYIEALRVKYNQLSIFYITREDYQENRAIIQSASGKIETLTNRKNYIIKRGNWRELRAYVKYFVEIFSGCTVYINKNNYVIESWSA